MIEPNDFISSRNGFAMPLADFMHHLMIVLDQLGMSMQARTNFITYASTKLFFVTCLPSC
jgi:hypothetical protein